MLDRTRSFAQVVGPTAVCYIQDGREFDAHGYPISSSDGLETMHWQTLKKLVEEQGHKWTTREAAIALLRG